MCGRLLATCFCAAPSLRQKYARKTNRFFRFAYCKTVLYPTGYCRTMCGRLLATCFGTTPSLRQEYARKTNRFFRFAFRKTVLYPTGYCRTSCGRLLATCFGTPPSLRQKYARKTNRFFRFAYCKTKKWFFTLLLRHNKKDAKASFLLWRRRRDSNPRYGLIHTTP